MFTPRCYDHRDQTRRRRDCATCERIAVERRIGVATVKALLDAGYELNVNNGGDDHELPHFTRDRAAILNAMMQTDTENLIARATREGQRSGWVMFVYGNDGWDVISDYLSALEPVMAPVMAYAASLEQ